MKIICRRDPIHNLAPMVLSDRFAFRRASMGERDTNGVAGPGLGRGTGGIFFVGRLWHRGGEGSGKQKKQ